MHISLWLLLAVRSENVGDSLSQSPSKWSRRTARKRERIWNLLSNIPSPSVDIKGIRSNGPASLVSQLQIDTLKEAPSIDWSLYPDLDPESGGLLKAGSRRASRKRRQIEAFLHVVQSTVQQYPKSFSDNPEKPFIIDAASGAGNLAIPLARLLNCNVLAMDVNEVALHRLKARDPSIHTQCVDLASSSSIVLPQSSVIVCSLHACGAATDLAIRLATRHGLPFCVSPCCTAKSLTQRFDRTDLSTSAKRYGPSSSIERSGSPMDLSYPRSNWLKSHLCSMEGNNNDVCFESYSHIAKVADVGLGPQTPSDQWGHQRLAKMVVELDRLVGVVEWHDYSVAMYRIQDHDDYGKAEILVGTPPSLHAFPNSIGNILLE